VGYNVAIAAVKVAGDREITSMSDAAFEPGQWVRQPDRPDWGVGQVQSVIGSRVTVMFENAGKVLVRIDHVDLVPADPDLA
jgi:hypothetical protein